MTHIFFRINEFVQGNLVRLPGTFRAKLGRKEQIMPSRVKLTRSRTTSRSTVARSSVKAGKIFQAKGQSKQYASVGHDGKYYSVNLANGELASSANGGKAVSIIGSFTYTLSGSLNPDCGSRRKVRRSSLKNGEIFHMPGGKILYGNLGKLSTGRWLAINLASGNHAVSSVRPNGNVCVVGNFELSATID